MFYSVKQVCSSILLMFLISINAFSFQAGEHTRISLFTAGPGPELYTIFGHNALRIQDTAQQIDVFFNYGTFNFSTPNFYMKFARGRLMYRLSSENEKQFLYTFIENGQYLKEQVLNLSTEQKQKIVDYIDNNFKPENREYKYDFYYDNCATRLRDIIYMAFDNQISYSDTFSTANSKAIRQILDPYMDIYPWAHFGIDLVMGLPADRKSDRNQEMFLPEYMLKHFSNASSNGVPIFKETIDVLPYTREEQKSSLFGKPIFIFWMLFIISFLSFSRFPKALPVLQKTWFTLWGIIGIVLFFMVFLTEHQATKDNLNLLWAFPLHLLVLLPESKLRRYYFKGLLGIGILIFISWILGFYPQGIHPAFIPIWATNMVLGWNMSYGKKL